MVSAPNPSVVVGGGIVGLATALAMAERGHPPLVLEAETRLAAHQTGHNSGVIHSGLYYKPGSVKARTCRAGVKALYRFCAEEGVPYRRCGKLVVAVNKDELPRLATLEERGRANGVSLQLVRAEEIKEYEPEVVGIAGLWIPETGVVNYSLVAEALARRLIRHGAEVRLGHRVLSIARDGAALVLQTTRGEVRASRVVNCAGLQSDRVARLAGVDPGIRIVPFRGEYYTLRPERAHIVRGLVYPVPDPLLPFLGVHFTRGIDDVVEAGPNAVLALKREGYSRRDVSLRDMADLAVFPGFWRMAKAQWRNGLEEARRSLSKARFLASLQKLVPALQEDDIAPGGSGVRAQAVGLDGRLVDDFCFLTAPGMLNVLNAPSPAATACLAIGREVADRILGKGTGASSGTAAATTRSVAGF